MNFTRSLRLVLKLNHEVFGALARSLRYVCLYLLLVWNIAWKKGPLAPG